MVDTDKDTGASGDLAAIDGPKALELLRAAVATRGPDYVYKPPSSGHCVYVADGKPSCVVGVALAIHGVPIAQLQKLDGQEKGGTSAAGLDSHLSFVNREAASVLGAAQAVQDEAYIDQLFDPTCTWGAALIAAEVELALVSS